MKFKSLVLSALTLSSASAFAIPASTNDLIRALVGDGKLNDAIKKEKSPISAVNISRVERNEVSELESLCGGAVNSKSAGALKVELVYEKDDGINNTAYSVNEYFVTSGNAADLKLCDGK